MIGLDEAVKVPRSRDLNKRPGTNSGNIKFAFIWLSHVHIPLPSTRTTQTNENKETRGPSTGSGRALAFTASPGRQKKEKFLQ
jgi:hypothetical protein